LKKSNQGIQDHTGVTVFNINQKGVMKWEKFRAQHSNHSSVSVSLKTVEHQSIPYQPC